jgi:hypothetical protein
MPAPLHDIFCAKVISEILAQLGKFQKSDQPFAEFAKKVDHNSTSRISLPNDSTYRLRTRSERSPDASFKHEQAKYPGVVIEVCGTEKVGIAADLADDYILHTNGNIKVVIALNIEYEGSEKATLSIWRPEDINVDGVDGVEELQVIAEVEALVHSRTAVLGELDTDRYSLFEQNLGFQPRSQPADQHSGCR